MHIKSFGLNCLRYRDTAREDNAGHFGFKAKLAALGLIFIQNGYSRWCVDMEVNDLSVLDHPMEKMVEVPREKLVSGLSRKDRETLVRLFIPDREKIVAAVAKAHAKGLPVILILTEPLCKDLAVRRKLFFDMIEQYAFADGKKGTAVIKPHPRDLLDYKKEFPDEIVLDARFLWMCSLIVSSRSTQCRTRFTARRRKSISEMRSWIVMSRRKRMRT